MFGIPLVGKKKIIGKPNEWKNKKIQICQHINSFINPDQREEEVNQKLIRP